MKEPRITKEFLYVDTEMIQITPITCLSCDGHDDMWFCPGIGTLTAGVHIFESANQAKHRLSEIVFRKLANAQRDVDKFYQIK